MFSKQKPSSLSCVETVGTGIAGHTLTELALAMTIMLVGGAVAFTAATKGRQLYDSDSARIDLNQNLRSAMDMMTTEIRQMGEHVPSDFPALELVDSASGDRLTLRRHRLESVLVSCADLAVADTRIFVAMSAGTGNCAIGADNDGNGYPDNIQEYRDHRIEYGDGGSPTVLPTGYIYDPTTRQGEYFAFENEEFDSGSGGWFLRLSGGGVAASYPASNQPRIYVLEQARYDLSSGTIELRRNGHAGTPLAVIDDVVGFRVSLLMQDSSVATAFTSSDDWTQIRSVRLQLTGEKNVRKRTLSRTLEGDVFPRNILSH